jgi:hypothetical protein
MTKFRLGISDIFVHFHRYRQPHGRALKCPLCQDPKEDELHFVLSCPELRDIREQFIPPKYLKNQCMFKLILLMSSTNESIVKQLAVYLYKAFKRRSQYLA